MILLTLWAVAALVLECTASLSPGRPPRLNKVGFDSTKLVECTEQPKTQKIYAGQIFHIQSPKYSKNNPTMECGWKFQVTGTENVMFACSKFEMEKRDRNGNCKDFLQIGDKKFCGKNGPKNITVNVKKLVEVKFASNKSAGGFSCTMTALFNNSNTLRQSAPSCTSLEFSCAPGECIPIWHDCDGITDCSNGLDEIDCPQPCTSIEFRCKPGECIPIWHDCDDVTDCSNGLDDYDCPPPCDSSEFRCKPGECIPIEWDCDGITDCSNALDQYECPKKWSDIRNACIKGNNNNDFPGMTIDECKEKCVNEESYSCQSIEYNPRNKGCYLSEAKSSSSDFYVPCFVRGWLYMEILQDPCETDKEWSDIRNACIRGNNNQDFKGVSIDVCKEKCFNEDSFNCQSIEYRSNDKWCFLSEVRSTSLDYNVPCYVDGWIYTERLLEDCVTAVCEPECLNNGTCVGLDDCRCKKGWEGDHCETAVCEPECLNNGTCIGFNDCECQEGWEGNHCQTAVCDDCSCQVGMMSRANCEDRCVPPCVNGKCIVDKCGFIYNSYKCDCDGTDFTGNQCQNPRCVPACDVGRGICGADNKCYCLGTEWEGKTCQKEKRYEWGWLSPVGALSVDKRPLIMIKPNGPNPVNPLVYHILYPEKKNLYRVGVTKDLLIACTKGSNKIDSFNKQFINTKCNMDGIVEAPKDDGSILQVQMDSLKCQEDCMADIKELGLCDPSLPNSKTLEVRFVSDGNGSPYYPLITACFDDANDKKRSIWTKHIIRGQHLLGSDGRPKNADLWKNNGPLQHLMDKVYKRSIQHTVIQNYITGLNPNVHVWNRGHMAPSSDFIIHAEKVATFHYINVMPQWPKIHGTDGNWDLLEQRIQDLARVKGDLTIITGGFGTLKLKRLSGAFESIELGGPSPNKVPVPAVTWKVVLYKEGGENKEGIAFITINNPYADHLDIAAGGTQDCSSPGTFGNFPLSTMPLISCADQRWNTFINDITKGCTYCCDISSLNTAIGGVPYGPYVPAAADDDTDPNAFKFLKGP